jgi:hypothetical protein
MPRKVRSTKKAALPGVKGEAVEALSNLAANGGKVQVLGRVRNGKLEIDQDSLAEMAKRFPNATLSFVAVNAPFVP